MNTHSVTWWPKGRFFGADLLMKVILLVSLTWLVFSKDVSLDFRLMAAQGVEQQNWVGLSSLFGTQSNSTLERSNLSPALQAKANEIPNLSVVLSKQYLKSKGVPAEIINEKLRVIQSYLKRYAPMAKKEMKRYGIPASVTLAQALLESDAGGSLLALETNNHFGLKCKSKCSGCTCKNYPDDDDFDMFRVFSKPADSFREHSLLLQGERYHSLYLLDTNDLEGWCHGLKKAGYATDPNYAPKLIHIIKSLKLNRYDR